MWKRRVMRLFLLLIAGAIVNVAVAWAGARFCGWPPVPGSEWTEDSSVWPTSVPNHWPETANFLRTSGGLWTISRYLSNASDKDETELYFMIDRYSFGWPLRALRSELWDEYVITVDAPSEVHRADGHPRPSIWRQGFATGRGFGMLPLTPTMPGFAINTIFYALILGAMWFAAGYMRRVKRLRRGLCPACAYPIGTSPNCTECGKPLPAVTPRSVEQ